MNENGNLNAARIGESQVSQTESGRQVARGVWVKPTLERISLNDALGGAGAVTDGSGAGYSS
jgi:hypothetical protein